MSDKNSQDNEKDAILVKTPKKVDKIRRILLVKRFVKKTGKHLASVARKFYASKKILLVKQQKLIGFVLGLSGILIAFLSFFTDKSENFPVVQNLFLSNEYKASKALQNLSSEGVINYESEGFDNLRSCLKTQFGFNRRSIRRIIAI